MSNDAESNTEQKGVTGTPDVSANTNPRTINEEAFTLMKDRAMGTVGGDDTKIAYVVLGGTEEYKSLYGTTIQTGTENTYHTAGEASTIRTNATFGDKQGQINLYNITDATQAAEKFGKIVGENAKKPIAESETKIEKGDTPEGIARKVLGKDATAKEVADYAQLLQQLNGMMDAKKLKPGDKVQLPGRNADGSFYFQNPDNSDEKVTVWPNGQKVENQKNGTGATWTKDKDGGYKEHHWGPKPEDNFDIVGTKDGTHVMTDSKGNKTTTYANGNSRIDNVDGTGYTRDAKGNEQHWGPKPEDNYSSDNNGIFRRDKDGNQIYEGYDGSRFVTDKNNRTVATFPNGETCVTEPNGKSTWNHRDGSTVVENPGGPTERTERNGEKTTTWPNGVVKNERPDGTGSVNTPDGQGGYTKQGWGPKPENNYKETYNPKDGITKREDATGTSTRYPDGSTKVENKDGTGYTRKPDGSEHHWGPKEKDNFDKSPDTKQLDAERQKLRDAADKNLPPEQRAKFKADMEAFEKRAKAQGIPPEEVAKTYQQTARLLEAKEGKVPAAERAVLAQNIMHHAANPENIDQGSHNTCNMTTLAERTFARQPSKAAEMIASVALTGEWKAPDGKVIKIDNQSLKPGAEEQFNPPANGLRSHATQIMNLVMINDATQRRVPPETYVQRPSTGPGDNGERLLDQNGKVMERKVRDPLNPRNWINKPIDEPTVTTAEINQVGRRLSGDPSVMKYGSEGEGTISFRTEKEMREHIKMLKDQHKLPIVLQVDANKPPFGNGNEYGSHVVSITDYDEKTGRVKISNQWGTQSDKWVDIKTLHKNTSGK